jgi:ABC-type sugar transport system, periplasmic component
MGGLEGKRVLMIGFDYHPGINLRAIKARELLEEAGAEVVGGEIKQVLNPGNSHEEALKYVTDYLQANPEGLDGVWTGWDHAAVGAAQAISEAGKDIPVTGVDAIGIALDAIKNGSPLRATVLQPWPEVLQVVIDAMEVYAVDGELPAENFVTIGVTLVDASNVDEIAPTDQ